MVIFHSYVKLPEGSWIYFFRFSDLMPHLIRRKHGPVPSVVTCNAALGAVGRAKRWVRNSGTEGLVIVCRTYSSVMLGTLY